MMKESIEKLPPLTRSTNNPHNSLEIEWLPLKFMNTQALQADASNAQDAY